MRFIYLFVILTVLTGCSIQSDDVAIVHGFSSLDNRVLYVSSDAEELLELRFSDNILINQVARQFSDIKLGDEIAYKVTDESCSTQVSDITCLEVENIKVTTAGVMSKEDVNELNLLESSSIFDIYDEQFKSDLTQIDVTSNDPKVYYFYQPTCSFCNANKGNVTNFVSDIKSSDVEFYAVDVSKELNKDLWYTDIEKYDDPVTQDPNFKGAGEIKSVNDLKITGTPSAIYVNDGEVVTFGVAASIYDVFNNAVSDAGITPTFDSTYMK